MRVFIGDFANQVCQDLQLGGILSTDSTMRSQGALSDLDKSLALDGDSVAALLTRGAVKLRLKDDAVRCLYGPPAMSCLQRVDMAAALAHTLRMRRRIAHM